MKKLKILLLSACPRMWSAGLADDMIKALEYEGHQVDFNYPEFEDDLETAKDECKPSLFYKVLRELRVVKLLNRLGFIFKFQERKYIKSISGHDFYNVNEETPLLDPQLLVSRLEGKEFDMIIVLFWVNVFNSTTMKTLYNYFKCPIFNYAVDMAPITGGCYYFGDCRNFKKECNFCPSLSGPLGNQPYKNYCLKKKNYASIEICTATNTWGGKFVEESKLFKNISLGSLIINDEIFHPKMREECSLASMIPTEKKFVMLARYCKIKRKGQEYLVEALKHFLSKLSDDEQKQVLLLYVGGYQKVEEKHLNKVDTILLGSIDTHSLVDAYAFSNVFLCPSIDDGGPSMVNQAMMCGTPVIAFDSGTAQDVVENGVSGYKVPKKDSVAFGEAIYQLFKTSGDDYEKLRRSTRRMAEKWNSPRAFVKQVEEVYQLFRA